MIEWELLSCFMGLLIIALIVVGYSLRQSISMYLLLVPMLIGCVAMAYWSWGDWSGWVHYRQEQRQLKQAKVLLQSIQNPQDLIHRLKEKVASQPNDARGWFLLGRLYASQNEWHASRDVYLKAHALDPDNEQITVNYAQSLWQLNNQRFDKKSRKLLQSVLDKNPNQPDALAMLAMDSFLGHSYQQAIDYWERLLDIVPALSDDAKAIRKAIAKAQKKLL